LLPTLIIEGKAEFELEVSENEVFFPPSKLTGPQVKNVCSREIVLCIKIEHVRRSCEKLLVAPSSLLTWKSWLPLVRFPLTFYIGSMKSVVNQGRLIVEAFDHSQIHHFR
jgi:hypothetical protein